MSASEQPFSHFEERYFLAEILKKSNLPPDLLFAIIRDHWVEPAWNDIALPHGRSVSSCQQAFNNIVTRNPQPPPAAPPPVAQPSPVGSTDFPRGSKRPYSSLGDATTSLPGGRELQPRPPGYPGMNGQQIMFSPPSQMAPMAPQRKKRGRPTKAEWERRQAEAQERGEVWPKPRKAKARPSTETGESSKAGAARAVADRGPAEAAAAGPPAATPSPDASRSVSGGPVQPPSAGRGPEASAASTGAVESGSEQAMEGVEQDPPSTTPAVRPLLPQPKEQVAADESQAHPTPQEGSSESRGR